MSAYPTDQRCPRCQYPVPPGATACVNCGLAFQSASGAYPGASPAYPQSPTPSAPGASYGTLPPSDPYGAVPPGYGSQQQPTYYSPQSAPGTYGAAPTVGSSLYPQAPAPGGYPGSQPAGFPPPPPPAYPGSQPAGFPPPPPTYPGGQPGTDFGAPPGFGSQPQSGFGAPPAVAAPPGFAAPPAPKKGKGLMIAIIVIVVVVLLGGGGTAAYLLTRPKPVITFDKTSPGTYAMGSTPAGAAGTVFCISGTKFSGNSTVTFLLDGQPVPDNSTAQTNSDGAISNSSGNNACGSALDAALMVTSNWKTGAHTLTAKDASNYTTQSGISIDVVDQGEAKTPGPNGSPYNSQTFTVNVTVTYDDGTNFPDTLNVTGHPDQDNGSVCQDTVDNGSEQDFTGVFNFSDGTSATYDAKEHYKCTGTYKKGMLTYTQTVTDGEYDVTYQGQLLVCTPNHYKAQILSGTFMAGTPGMFSGNYSAEDRVLTCQGGGTITTHFSKATWTGTVG